MNTELSQFPPRLKIPTKLVVDLGEWDALVLGKIDIFTDKLYDYVSIDEHTVALACKDADFAAFFQWEKDEYVKQVGRWKIVQRLEEQVYKLHERNKELGEALVKCLNKSHDAQYVHDTITEIIGAEL